MSGLSEDLYEGVSWYNIQLSDSKQYSVGKPDRSFPEHGYVGWYLWRIFYLNKSWSLLLDEQATQHKYDVLLCRCLIKFFTS